MDYHLKLKQRVALEMERVIRRDIINRHPLRQLFWECTLRCNMHCRHCGSDCRKVMATPDMPREDFFGVLDNVAANTDASKVFIIVTGGEPLMRDDLEECGRGFHERGFAWGMVTNGFLLTPERFQSLLDAHLYTVALSIDGLADDHNWMRGHPESFHRASQALDLLVAEPLIKFDVVTCVNRRNYPHLDEIREWLIGKGVRRWRIFTVFPMGRAVKDPAMHLTGDEFRGVFEFLKKTRKEGRIRANYGCEGFLGNYEGEVRDRLFACHAGVTVGSVLADGAISACTSIRSDYHQGNIYEDDFMDVWETRFHPYRRREWMRRDECASCEYFRYCEGGGMHLRDGEGKLLLCHLKRLR